VARHDGTIGSAFATPPRSSDAGSSTKYRSTSGLAQSYGAILVKFRAAREERAKEPAPELDPPWVTSWGKDSRHRRPRAMENARPITVSLEHLEMSVA
jgi:hypothetical protein